jgi:hypothetical protein
MALTPIPILLRRSHSSQPKHAVPITFLWVYLPGMVTIDHASQPELPIAQRITCRRCKGAGTVYFGRVPVEVIGGKLIRCPECNGVGTLDLAEQLFRYVTVSHYKNRRAKRPESLVQQLNLT